MTLHPSSHVSLPDQEQQHHLDMEQTLRTVDGNPPINQKSNQRICAQLQDSKLPWSHKAADGENYIAMSCTSLPNSLCGHFVYPT